jgi:hypothetical protein
MGKHRLLDDATLEAIIEIYDNTRKGPARVETIMKKVGITNLEPIQVMNAIRKHKIRKQKRPDLITPVKLLEPPKNLNRPPAIYSNKGNYYYNQVL